MCRAIEILTMHVSQINLADIIVGKDCSYYKVGRISNSCFLSKQKFNSGFQYQRLPPVLAYFSEAEIRKTVSSKYYF